MRRTLILGSLAIALLSWALPPPSYATPIRPQYTEGPFENSGDDDEPLGQAVDSSPRQESQPQSTAVTADGPASTKSSPSILDAVQWHCEHVLQHILSVWPERPTTGATR